MKKFLKDEFRKFVSHALGVVAAFVIGVIGLFYLVFFPLAMIYDYYDLKKKDEDFAKESAVRKKNIQTVKEAMDALKKAGPNNVGA